MTDEQARTLKNRIADQMDAIKAQCGKYPDSAIFSNDIIHAFQTFDLGIKIYADRRMEYMGMTLTGVYRPKVLVVGFKVSLSPTEEIVFLTQKEK